MKQENREPAPRSPKDVEAEINRVECWLFDNSASSAEWEAQARRLRELEIELEHVERPTHRYTDDLGIKSIKTYVP